MRPFLTCLAYSWYLLSVHKTLLPPMDSECPLGGNRIDLWPVVRLETYLVFQKSVLQWEIWRISVFAPCMISWRIRICTWHLSWQNTGWTCWCFTTESGSRFKVSRSVWRNNWGKGSLGTVKLVRWMVPLKWGMIGLTPHCTLFWFYCTLIFYCTLA